MVVNIGGAVVTKGCAEGELEEEVEFGAFSEIRGFKGKRGMGIQDGGWDGKGVCTWGCPDTTVR